MALLEYSNESVFLTSPELAARFDTDPATVVQTVQALAYLRPSVADTRRCPRTYRMCQ
jgi:hypothetical protein